MLTNKRIIYLKKQKNYKFFDLSYLGKNRKGLFFWIASIFLLYEKKKLHFSFIYKKRRREKFKSNNKMSLLFFHNLKKWLFVFNFLNTSLYTSFLNYYELFWFSNYYNCFKYKERIFKILKIYINVKNINFLVVVVLNKYIKNINNKREERNNKNEKEFELNRKERNKNIFCDFIYFH